MKTQGVLGLAKTYAAYRRRVDTCVYPPTRLWVETTSHCNLRCSFCGNKMLDSSNRGLMDMDLFHDIADQSAGLVNRFNLFHRGEALLHPQIGEMVRYAGSRGIRSRINTNGLLLDRSLGRELIESGLDILSFSFDGYDRQMYDANRPGSDYDVVLSNILGVLNEKKQMDSRKPFIAIELMEISDLPHAELVRKRQEFLKLFHGLPMDKFIIRKPHNWGGMLGMDEGASTRRMIPCPLLWSAIVVFWDGRVMPCPQDFFGSLQIGDIRSESLQDIWNGNTLKELRRKMAHPNSIEISPCSTCDRIRRTTIAGVPTDYLGRFLSETVFGNSWLSRVLPH